MNRFAIARPASFEDAHALLRDGGTADRRFSLPVVKAGGMDLIDHLKEGLLEPDLLVDVRRLRSGDGRDGIELDRAGTAEARLRIEANTTLAELAGSPVLAQHAPALADSARSAATPQVRNVATVAGNLLQRPRCWYYRNDQFDCLKKGGFQCFAVEGENRYHAVFSEGPCFIVHPSNIAPVLYVCDGTAHVTGGERETIPLAKLYHAPDRGIRSEHDLGPAELITSVSLRPAPASGFYAIKEKQSFDWPLVMAAAALEMDGDRIRSARICAGAVAPVPWPLPRVEEALRGVRLDDESALSAACAVASEGGRPLADNAYKLRLLPVAVRRAVLEAAGRSMEATR